MTADVSSDDQRDLWFLNTRVLIRVSYQDGADNISILEHWPALGDSPPLHVHHSEDEVFRSSPETCGSTSMAESRGPQLVTSCWSRKARLTPTGSSRRKGLTF